jgi:hypothetical protein
MRKGERVSWKWGKHRAEGKIVRKYTVPVEKSINDTTINRNALAKEPAYMVEQKNGGRVLKSESELKSVKSKR